MIIVVNLIEINVTIEVIIIIIINHPLEIVRNHVNIVVNLTIILFLSIRTIFVFFCVLALLYTTISFLLYANGKNTCFYSFFSLLRCMYNREGKQFFISHFVFMYSHCTFSLFCDIIQEEKRKKTKFIAFVLLSVRNEYYIYTCLNKSQNK